MISTHRVIQLSQLADSLESISRSCDRAAKNAASIRNLNAANHFADRARKARSVLVTVQSRLERDERQTRAAEAAAQWEAEAASETAMADYYDGAGRPYGDTTSYRNRAACYTRTAKALRLEAETGRPHCSVCFGDHPNHLHMHQG